MASFIKKVNTILYLENVDATDEDRDDTEVAVSMDCAGYIDNEVSIFNVYDLDMRTTDVVGCVGAAVDIEITQEFDEATITFAYDEEALGDYTHFIFTRVAMRMPCLYEYSRSTAIIRETRKACFS